MNKRLLGLIVLFVLLAVQQIQAQRLITLQQSVEEALKQSPDIVRARYNLERYRELLNAQKASLKSNFRLDLSPFQYSNSRNYYQATQSWYHDENFTSSGTFSVSQPILLTDGVVSLSNDFGWQTNKRDDPNYDPFTGFTNSLNLRLEQPLFTYNTRKMEYKKIEFNYENSQLDYALQALNVEKQITQYFYQIYQAQMELITSREELANRRKSFEIIKNKVEAGLTAKEEELQAELDMLSSESTVQNNEVNLENIKDNFKQMLGMDFSEEIMVIAEVSVLPIDIELQKAVDFALENRMEIRQRQIDIEMGLFDIITTNATNEFKGNLAVQVGLFGNAEKLPNIYDKTNRNDNQDVQFSLEVPLWDWGEKKARMKAAQLAQETNEYNLTDQKKNIVLTVRQIERNLKNYLKQIDIARKNEENAQLTYEINLEKYQNGDLTSMDLNLVQNQLTQAKNDKIDALINYKLELLNMKLQTLFDFENQRNIMPDVIKYETLQ
ncbi:TolC family protein [Carboxylicivirga caseinilyticus]|uniref:TolC family protein n=1 Tax=Carboxylicivirga caseinilyticus TaxID=3417572 RepID=UPI003D35473B|nr:TolC family protein [Marinilabiliaceae bacterium A049]